LGILVIPQDTTKTKLAKTGEQGARGFLEIVHLSCHIGHLANLFLRDIFVNIRLRRRFHFLIIGNCSRFLHIFHR